MRRKLSVIIIFVIVLSSAFNSVNAQEEPTTKVSGYVMADYYWVAQNHNDSLNNLHGFWFRRIYLGFDHKFDEAFSSRLRFEMSSPGDFETKSKLSTIIKDAFLQWKTGNHSILIGMSSTPTWGIVEKIWGYRSVEKTLLDIQRFGSSRDIGFAAKGKIDNSGLFKYHVMMGNGASNDSEINKGKKFFGSISAYPTKEIIFEVYGDYADNEGGKNQYTGQLFATYKNEDLNIALQYFHRTNQIPGGEDAKFDGVSAWITHSFTSDWSAYARADKMFQANPEGEKIPYIPFDKTAKSTLLIFGLDFHPIPNIKFLPNVEVVLYDENDSGVKPDTDIIPRISFFFGL